MTTVDDWAPAPLQNVAARLDPVGPQHYAFLRDAEILVLGPGWRHRGAVASPAEFERGVWSGILCQFLIVRESDDEPIGWVQAYNADIANSHCHLSVGRFHPRTMQAEFGVGFTMFVDYLFDNWSFIKLYLDVAEFNMAPLRSALGTLLREEGVLRQHLWAGGNRHDLRLLALWRDTWEAAETVARLRDLFPVPTEPRIVFRRPPERTGGRSTV